MKNSMLYLITLGSAFGISLVLTPVFRKLALVFGIVNTFIRPVLRFFTFPITLLTLGLFTLVINAAMLLLTARIAESVGISFAVRGFIPALLGAICVSVLSTIMSAILISDSDKDDDK